jgi:hypothetical protein
VVGVTTGASVDVASTGALVRLATGVLVGVAEVAMGESVTVTVGVITEVGLAEGPVESVPKTHGKWHRRSIPQVAAGLQHSEDSDPSAQPHLGREPW